MAHELFLLDLVGVRVGKVRPDSMLLNSREYRLIQMTFVPFFEIDGLVHARYFPLRALDRVYEALRFHHLQGLRLVNRSRFRGEHLVGIAQCDPLRRPLRHRRHKRTRLF